MQGYDHFFPFIIHRENLPSIQGVNFTPREMDIISCLVHVRGDRKISSLLSISPSTVLSHTRHIMLKLDCHSRESIIDFIEQSQVLPKIRERYNHLVLHARFEKHLKDIRSNNAKASNPSLQTLLVLHGGNLEHQKTLRINLSKHLKQAGLRVDIESINAKKRLPSIKTYTYRLLLCFASHTEWEIPKKFHEFDFVNLFESQNYYLFVFALLKKLLPQLHLGTYVQSFTMQWESMGSYTGFSDDPLKNNNNIELNINLNNITNFIKNKKFYILLFIFCLFLGHYTQQIFKKNQNLNEFKIDLELSIPLHVTIIQQPEDKLQVQKADLKKQALTEGHFVITGLSIYLEKAPKNLGEQRGAKTERIMTIKKMEKGSNGHVPSK